MAILKVRDLAKIGVVTDIDPYDLPIGAWSFAVNARFYDGKVSHAPVWRKAATISADPRFAFVRRVAGAVDDLFIGYKTGRVFKWSNSVETDYSIAGYVNSSVEDTWSSCSLANVLYVNRRDRVPWGLLPGASVFTGITGWDANWRAKIFRAFNSSLIALNVTKSGVNYPTLVKASDIVSASGTMPTTWDHTITTNNAVEVPLTDMQGEIMDACVLGDDLIIYGTTQNFAMRADSSVLAYSFRQLPFDGGAINAGCAVEVDGKHFVFGPSDIYVHDGLTKVSLVDGSVRKHIFGTMNAAKASQFFVSYNPNTKDISFNYIGTDGHATFLSSSGCNRAAVYHVPKGTWSFDDTPLLHAGVVASITVNSPTWATTTSTWENVGGSWQDLEDGLKKVPVYVGEANATYSLVSALYCHDVYGQGSIVNAVVDVNATRPMYLERDGVDLDEVGADLRGYKHIISIYPQGRVDADSQPLQFSFGASDHFGKQVVFSAYQTYDTRTDHKLDFNESGRYLALRVRYDDYKTASLTGLDLDVEILSDAP